MKTFFIRTLLICVTLMVMPLTSAQATTLIYDYLPSDGGSFSGTMELPMSNPIAPFIVNFTDILDFSFEAPTISLSWGLSDLNDGEVGANVTDDLAGGHLRAVIGSGLDAYTLRLFFGSSVSGQEDHFVIDTNGGNDTLLQGTGEWVLRASPVPIPAATWLFGSGLLGLIGFARRKVS